ncbi:type II toxin-antitoxin system VapC family toxin [Candidatus Bathyarchaeota archaeon]|nr:type II toxin-antitoxin system VapC family toxin [Candidatus Bathyarchaeota archaeon]
MTLIDSSVAIDSLQYDIPKTGAISIVTLLELLRGVSEEKRPKLKTHLEEYYSVIGIDNDITLEYCRVFESLRSGGELIPEADMIIAATAISRNLELETANGHFSRLLGYGLKLRITG